MADRLAVFYCDVSPAAGQGHVSRCRALADALAAEGWRTDFVGDAAPGGLPSADILVVDHYGCDRNFERPARARARRIVVIDDLADRPHDCDVLIDYSPGRRAGEYAALVPDTCVVFAGPAYALLRPEFAAARRRAVPRTAKPVERVLVNFGSVDVPAACRAVAGLGFETDVVTGGLGAAAYAARMAAADLALGAAGVTALERCCLGLPSILITVADNQRHNAVALHATGAARSLGWHADVSVDQIAAAVRELAADTDARAAMSCAAASVCDGEGARRVAAALREAVVA